MAAAHIAGTGMVNPLANAPAMEKDPEYVARLERVRILTAGLRDELLNLNACLDLLVIDVAKLKRLIHEPAVRERSTNLRISE